MASLLDISLLENGSSLFAFILVLVISYALLTSINIFKLSKFNATVAAICFSMLTLFNPAILNSIKVMTPWFGIIIAFIIFLIVALFTLGYTQKDMAKALASKDYGMQIKVWIIVVGGIIFIASIASQFAIFGGGGSEQPIESQQITPEQEYRDSYEATATAQSSGNRNAVAEKGEDALIATLFHPKMLGMIALMLIAVFASIFLSASNKV